MDIIERLQKNLEEYKRKVKENPRYAIEHRADKDGNLSIFFTPEGFIKYSNGEEVKGSTERFLPDDIIHKVNMDKIESITDGGTIAHIRRMEDKLEQIKNRWGNSDGMGIAHPILEDELEEDVEYLIQLIEQMKAFIEGNEFDLTPEFRRHFPDGIR